jgi:antitoxin ParD1/3/4
MPTQNVNLTPELEAFVKRQVATGHFNNASEVHRAALSAMAQHEEERQLRLDLLRRELQLGVDDLDSGRFTETSTLAGLKKMISGIKDEASRKAKR